MSWSKLASNAYNVNSFKWPSLCTLRMRIDDIKFSPTKKGGQKVSVVYRILGVQAVEGEATADFEKRLEDGKKATVTDHFVLYDPTQPNAEYLADHKAKFGWLLMKLGLDVKNLYYSDAAYSNEGLEQLSKAFKPVIAESPKLEARLKVTKNPTYPNIYPIEDTIERIDAPIADAVPAPEPVVVPSPATKPEITYNDLIASGWTVEQRQGDARFNHLVPVVKTTATSTAPSQSEPSPLDIANLPEVNLENIFK